jgi:hypothetical protein
LERFESVVGTLPDDPDAEETAVLTRADLPRLGLPTTDHPPRMCLDEKALEELDSAAREPRVIGLTIIKIAQ